MFGDLFEAGYGLPGKNIWTGKSWRWQRISPTFIHNAFLVTTERVNSL